MRFFSRALPECAKWERHMGGTDESMAIVGPTARQQALPDRAVDRLMPLVQGGDFIGFQRLYSVMTPLIGNFIAARCRRRTAADDIVQEVFCRLWQRRERFVAERGHRAETYLLQIARNVVRERTRAQRRVKMMLDTAPRNPRTSQAIGQRLLADELSQALCAARARLSPNQAEAIRLVYDEQQSPRAAALRVGFTEKALRRRLEEAHRKLRRILAPIESPAGKIL